MWRPFVWLEIGGKEEKTCSWLGILHKVSKIYLFQAIIHFTIFNAIISEFGACLAQSNKAQEQPYPKVIVERLVGSHLDKISRTKLRHENAAWLLSAVQNGGNDVRILGFFGDEFQKENLHFRGWNFGEWLNLVQGFYWRWQKIYVFWSDLLL